MRGRRVRAVIFDWAGTVVDHGSLAPMGAFVETFAEFGIEISVAEAREPMGMAKRPHVAAILGAPRVAQAWRDRYGRAAGEDDVEALYAAFLPRNLAVAARYARPIDGAVEVARGLRESGIRIGSTTGYTREIMARIIPVAAQHGFEVDAIACTGDTVDGRPTPLMLYKNLLDLGVWPAWCAIKVDDTEVGIAEGLNGGAWTVGVAVTGNLFGLSPDETRALAPAEREARRSRAAARLAAAGAHYVIDGVADLLPVVAAIEGQLARGERP